MPTRKETAFLITDVGLSRMGILNAVAIHEERSGHPPTTLLCEVRDVQLAYELVSGQHGPVPRLLVVPVPGWSGWAVCSPTWTVMSGGG